MEEKTWRNRVAVATNDDAKHIADEIAAKLKAHYLNGVITKEQLHSINQLAANTEQLKSVLTWL